MENNDIIKSDVDIFTVLTNCRKKLSLFIKVALITAVVSSLFILCVPRYYQCSVVLAPENSAGSEGALGTITSAMGMNLGNALTSDAIYPDLYPQVLESNNFIKKLINIPIESQDHSIKTTYYEYILKHKKKNPLLIPLDKMRGAIVSLFSSKKDNASNTGGNKDLNPFKLTEEQNNVFGDISSKVNCSINIKTGAITISVKEQDPLICATIADSVRAKLQDFIIDYRTNKSRIDVNHYRKLAQEAKQNYEKARQLYGSYSDSNMDVIIESYRLKQNDLENDMQLKFNTYTMMQNQLQMAQAKLQERTPAFTVIKGASVPLHPAGPKRMAFVLTMLFLAMISTAIVINKDIIKKAIRESN